MDYVTSFERRGSLLTAQDDIITVLDTRFGEPPELIIERLKKIDSLRRLKNLLKKAVIIGTLNDFERDLKKS